MGTCEVNKFPDMIDFLVAHNRGFEQVIAVDDSMDIFTRCWAMAEVERCYRLGVVQHIKLKDADSLDGKEQRIRNLRISQMQATRPEDIQEILAGIPDLEAFDLRLNRLILDTRDGLLNSYRRVDGRSIMERIGVCVRLAWVRSQSLEFRTAQKTIEQDGYQD